MKTNRIYNYGILATLVTILIAIGFSLVLSSVFAHVAKAAEGGGAGSGGSVSSSATGTAEFLLLKKISDNIPGDPYAPEDFSFNIEGYGIVNLTPGPGAGVATAIVELELGTYEVNEVGPEGFVPEDWTLQWSSYGCESGNGPVRPTTITVIEDPSDSGPDAAGNVCWADNQYRGEDPSDGEDGDATLIVEKVVLGTSTAPDAFAFSVNGGATTPFESDGDNEMLVATGTYSIAEVGDTTDYVTTYDNCTDLELEAGDTETCTITNRYKNDGDGGNGGHEGGGSIGGTKYDAASESTVSGWTVELYDGEDLVTSTTTDGDGEYWFVDIAPGDYVVCEALQQFWHQTQPTDGPECANGTLGHDVTITGSSTEDGNDFWNIHDPVIIIDKVTNPGGSTQKFEFNASWLDENFFLKDTDEPFNSGNLTDLIASSSPFSVAEVSIAEGWTLDSAVCESSLGHAQTPDAITLNPGEVVTCTYTNSTDRGDGGGNNDDGDGESKSGGGEKIELTESGGGGGRTPSGGGSPQPEVLGEDISAVPAGAPNTGFGGTSSGGNNAEAVLLILLALGLGIFGFYSPRFF